MTIKQRIVRLLEEMNWTYSDLLNDINSSENVKKLSEKELDLALENLDLNILEKVSKSLRIPLYSFHKKQYVEKPEEKRFYDKDIWKFDEGENKEN